MRVLFLFLVAALLAACPGAPPPVPPQPPSVVGPRTPPPPAQTDGRLPALAIPTHYALDLDVDPTQTRFGGAVRIDVEVPRPTSWIVLHARALEIKSARLERPNRPPTAARATSRLGQGGTDPEELVLAFDTPLDAGPGLLVIEWSTTYDDSLAGLYHLREGELWYAFTQFEPADARRAFPCFDEPSLKVPFDVSVTVPRAMIAVANAPEASREEVGGKTRFRFEKTPPLPTYLVALAVGELEIKEAARYSKPPVRIITTKGKTTGPEDLTALALDATSGLVDALGEWFAIPYPYAKLDIVAVPDFSAGAMENAGLVTFREETLLLDPKRSSADDRRDQGLTIAHELAHQWFGDLVTASWWNDLWLNEGMATWMEMRIVEKWRPAMGARADAVAAAHGVMDTDGLVSARAVRQPVVSTGDAESAFDGITYEKGAAVLSTIERWVGEETFQRAIREYLRENSWKSVQANRLLETLDKASGKDVTQMAAAYLDRPGVPEVTAHLACDPGSRWHVEMGTQPWRPLGSKMPEESDQSWTIPACIRAAGEKRDTCTDLTAGAPSLVAGRGCPAFVHPNVGGSYYRFTTSEKEFTRIAEGRAQLDVASRVALLSSAWASVRSGQLEAKAMLKILPAFDDDPARQVVEEVVRILAAMSRSVILEEARPAFRKFALGRLVKRKKALGVVPPPKGEASFDAPLVRREVLVAMADVAEDDATLREVDEVAMRWLADPSSVQGDAGAVALDLASRRAGEPRLEALRGALKSAKTREDRTVILKALYGFDDAVQLEHALALTLGEEIRANELRYVFGAVFGRRTSRPIAEAWVRVHWDELRKKLPGRLSTSLVRAAAVGCSTEEAEEHAKYYGAKLATVEGSARGLGEALEAVSLCAALREKSAQKLRNTLLGR